ncbi:hypothetical protein DFA_06940 [Cavenderia fasciculata]|uniref:Uncharacterized protein n=1 Tax=Cavenderia fasciculata TaxID=261658 RepID=F4PX35_CACFS|nr:uncharacterized protein DFA_06940 [Cavenderia fasciculata]EGG19838.1 hypothetical protein DFA_06940 [Cavenderia fasciculata]|eukprot:XP_004358184.1 hypothetical protein DFA_06940 [Cavenderia fasciculata]
MEPEVSINPNDSQIKDHITVVNYMSRAIVVFMKSGSQPVQIDNTKYLTTIFPGGTKQSIAKRIADGQPISTNLLVTGEIGYLFIFVAVNEEGKVPRYMQLVDRRVVVGSRFNVLTKHYYAAIQTDTRQFDEHFQLIRNDVQPAPLFYELSYPSPTDQEEQQEDYEDIK